MANIETFALGSEPIDRLVLSVDSSTVDEAHRMIAGFSEAGGTIIKLGLELQSVAGGPEGLSQIAKEHGMRWVYDGKIKDIQSTMTKTVKNIVAYDHPPAAITMHADISLLGMRSVQETAGKIPILGVTLLTDIGPEEAYQDYSNELEKRLVERGLSIVHAGEMVRRRVVLERANKLAVAGVLGAVASSKELNALLANEVTAKLLKMVPGTRSTNAEVNDQANTMTPEDAMAEGADLLVLGRQYTEAEDKPKVLSSTESEVGRGMERRFNSAQ